MICIKKLIIGVTTGILLVFIFYILFPSWILDVLKLLKKPETFISLLTTSIGIIGAYLVANYQISKSLKYSSPQYLQNFNTAQVPIRYFIEIAKKISNVISTEERIEARYKIYWSDFKEMEENLFCAIQIMNPEISDELVRKDLPSALSKINEHAPPYYYKSMNFLFYQMIYIYDSLLKESEHLDLFGDKSNLKYISSYISGPKFTPEKIDEFIKNNKKKYKQLNLDQL